MSMFDDGPREERFLKTIEKVGEAMVFFLRVGGLAAASIGAAKSSWLAQEIRREVNKLSSTEKNDHKDYCKSNDPDCKGGCW